MRFRTSRRGHAIALSTVALMGCTAEFAPADAEDTATISAAWEGDPKHVAYDDLQQRLFLWDGFRFEWDKTPHRFNQLGAKIYRQEYDASSLTGRTRTTLLGGTWSTGEEGSDDADYDVWYTATSSSRLQVHHGTTGAMTLSGSAVGDRTAAMVSETVTIDRHAAGLSDADQCTVVLRGLRLDAGVTHGEGWTTRGFGARILELVTTDDELRFAAWLRAEADNNPDRPAQDLAEYTLSGHVYYTAICVVDGEITDGTHRIVLNYPPNTPRPPATAAQQRTTISGAPGFDHAVVGLRGFDFRLNQEDAALGGRYLRDVRVRQYDRNYNASTGEMAFRSDGYFSNDGPSGLGALLLALGLPIPTTMHLQNDYRADHALIQFDDPEASVRHGHVAGEQRIGGHSYETLFEPY